MRTLPLFGIARWLLVAAVFAPVVVTTSTIFPFIAGKFIWFRASVDLALIAFSGGLLFHREAEGHSRRLAALVRSPLGIAVAVFTAVSLAAGMFGVNPANSFWSDFERGEGGLQILHYAAFFFLAGALLRDERDWRRMFVATTIAALLAIGYGVGASLKYADAEIVTRDRGGFSFETELTGNGGPVFQMFKRFAGPSWSEPGYRFPGSLGNPAYAAGYFLLSLVPVLALLASSTGGRRWKITLAGAAAILIGALMWTGTRAAFLGFGAGTAVFLLVAAFMEARLRKNALIAAAAGAIVIALLFAFRGSDTVRRLPGSRVLDLSLSTETFRDRTMIWRAAWEGFKERPALGWGPENLVNLFARHADPRLFKPQESSVAWSDRAHNLILDYLAATGAIGTLAFLGIFAVFYVCLLRAARARRITSAPVALLAAFPAAYLVQGLALFDVLPISLLFFLLLAFAASRFLTPEPAGSPALPREAGTWRKPALCGAAAIGAGGALVYGAMFPWIAARRYAHALNTVETATSVSAYQEKLASFLRVPGFVGKSQLVGFAGGLTLGAMTAGGGQAENASRVLAAYIEPLLSPEDLRHLFLRASLHADLWKRFRDPADFRSAEADFMHMLAIGPRIPQALYGLFDLYQGSDEAEKAKNVAQTILAYWPDDERIRAAVR